MNEFYHSHTRTWRAGHTLLLVAMISVCLWAFRAPMADAVSVAMSDQDQSHILLAPIVAVWLAWLRRSRLIFVRFQPSILGPVLVGVAVLACGLGLRFDIHTAWYAGPLFALVGMIVSVAGLRPLRLFFPSFLAMVFAVPVPGVLREAVSLPLQSVAAAVTHGTLESLGVQAARMGNVIFVNGEQVVLAEACSGLRLVFALTLVVFAFAFSLPLRTGTRLLLLVLSPAIALMANVVRLIPTSLLYGRVSAADAAAFHDISGWIMLPLALLLLVALLRLLRWLEYPITTYRLAGL